MARYGRTAGSHRRNPVKAQHIGIGLAFVVALSITGHSGQVQDESVLASDAYLATTSAAIEDQQFLQTKAQQKQSVTTYLDTRKATTTVTRATRTRKIAAAKKTLKALSAKKVRTFAPGASVIDVASSLAGVPYRRGGTSTSGFDCSGYTQYVFAQVGIELPRMSSSQSKYSEKISRSSAKPGDLVFFHSKSGYIYHVGIYAGGGLMWHSPVPGQSVKKVEIFSGAVTFGRVPTKAADAALTSQINDAKAALNAAEKLQVTPEPTPSTTP